MEDGYYYLHQNGDLIWKKFHPENDSPFVVKVWAIDTKDRLNAWRILLEALYFDARVERVRELALRWDINYIDLPRYLMHETDVNTIRRKGLRLLCEDVWGMNFDRLMDYIYNTPDGECPDMTKFPTEDDNGNSD